MPGGFGTLDEIFETLTLIQTGKIEEFPIVLVGREYWAPMLAFLEGTMVARGTIDPEDLARIAVTDSVDEVVECIRDRAMRRFGLTYGSRARPRWWLGER
jgi:predicted Rossmann-fold nucleotide-binding protein